MNFSQIQRLHACVCVCGTICFTMEGWMHACMSENVSKWPENETPLDATLNL